MEFPNIDPVALSIGPITIYWYALAYIAGIFGCIIYAQKVSPKYSLGFSKEHFDNLFTYIILGIIIGGRTGYVILYDPLKYIDSPLEIVQTYKGGMSFHGGVVGFLIAFYVFAKRNNVEYLKLLDLAAIVAPFAIMLGRIANFINAELYGRITSMPWGVVFPRSDSEPRHPSQLYEAILEGAILLLIMRFASKKLNNRGFCLGVSLIFYSIFRIFCEFFREPDFHIGFIAGSFTMGQLLSVPLLIVGLFFYHRSCR